MGEVEDALVSTSIAPGAAGSRGEGEGGVKPVTGGEVAGGGKEKKPARRLGLGQEVLRLALLPCLQAVLRAVERMIMGRLSWRGQPLQVWAEGRQGLRRQPGMCKKRPKPGLVR